MRRGAREEGNVAVTSLASEANVAPLRVQRKLEDAEIADMERQIEAM